MFVFVTIMVSTRRSVLRWLGLLVFCACVAPTSPVCAVWFVQTVDSGGVVGQYTSIALDSRGSPHISYFDDSNDDLRYAYWNGSAWVIQTVDNVESVGLHTSLKLDSFGNPHIAYYDYANRDLKYARWDGFSWVTQTVDSAGAVGQYCSLAIDSSGNAHISYLGGSDLKYARWTGVSWVVETLDADGVVGFFTSIALDGNDHPCISYYDYTNMDLKYVRWGYYQVGGVWRWLSGTVDTPGDVGKYSSVRVDNSGTIYVSYFDATNGDLRYAYSWPSMGDDGYRWFSASTLDSIGVVGEYTAIDVSSLGDLSIAYYDSTNKRLKCARRPRNEGSEWLVDTVDSSGQVGQYASLALDTGGNAHISYYDAQNQDLKYAYYFGDPPLVEDEGRFTASSERLSATWFGYVPYGVVEYQYAVGESLSNLLVGWKSAGTATTGTETDLSLEAGKKYYWYVKVQNGHDLWSEIGSSDGITIATPCSIGDAKTENAGKPVHLQNAVVTSTTSDHPGLWIESGDRAGGVRVGDSLSLARGQKLDIAGVVSWSNGVPTLGATEIKNTYSQEPVIPPFFTTRSLANDRTESLNYVGVNPVGLLAVFAGRVTRIDTSSAVFYVDDGTRLADGMGPSYDPFIGLRVSYPTSVVPPAPGKRVRVTGIRTVQKVTLQYGAFVNGQYRFPGETLYLPVVRVRDQADIRVY